MKYPTSATVGCAGDPSVGIPSSTWHIQGDFPTNDTEEREFNRKVLQNAFSDIAGEPCSCVFNDEERDYEAEL